MSRPRKLNETQDPGRLKLLLVDDGTLITPALMRALTNAGFRVELVANAEFALADSRGQQYDAVAINDAFNEVDALWLCLALRVQGCAGVIMIIGEAPTETEQLAAWRAGANDHVPQAMPRDALVERIAAHVSGSRIRVTGLLHPVTAELPTSAGRFRMSLVPTLVTLDEKPFALTRIEERLFARLWAARGAAVPSEELIASAWLGRRVAIATLRVHLYQLRRKLDKLGLTIERIGSRGYRLPSLLPASTRRNGMPSRSKN
jgi:two-component system, OmpR family, response regulator